MAWWNRSARRGSASASVQNATRPRGSFAALVLYISAISFAVLPPASTRRIKIPISLLSNILHLPLNLYHCMIAQVVKRFTCPRLIFCPLLPMAAQKIPISLLSNILHLPLNLYHCMIAQVVKRFTCPRLIFCPLLPMAAQPSGRHLPDPCILLQAAAAVNPETSARKPVLQSRTEV